MKLKLSEMKINKRGVNSLLFWAIVFLVAALVAGLLGFTSVAGVSLTIAKWLAIIFVVLFVITLIAHAVKKA